VGKDKKLKFLAKGDEQYIEGLASRIIEPTKARNLFCDFESKKKKAARKLCVALRQLGFEAYRDDEDRRLVLAAKPVIYSEAKAALNAAMRKANKHSCTLVSLMLEQDKVANNASEQ